MVFWCSVPDCNFRSYKALNYYKMNGIKRPTVFRPKSEEESKAWSKILKLSKPLGKLEGICQAHFRHEDVKTEESLQIDVKEDRFGNSIPEGFRQIIPLSIAQLKPGALPFFGKKQPPPPKRPRPPPKERQMTPMKPMQPKKVAQPIKECSVKLTDILKNIQPLQLANSEPLGKDAQTPRLHFIYQPVPKVALTPKSQSTLQAVPKKAMTPMLQTTLQPVPKGASTHILQPLSNVAPTPTLQPVPKGAMPPGLQLLPKGAMPPGLQLLPKGAVPPGLQLLPKGAMPPGLQLILKSLPKSGLKRLLPKTVRNSPNTSINENGLQAELVNLEPLAPSKPDTMPPFRKIKLPQTAKPKNLEEITLGSLLPKKIAPCTQITVVPVTQVIDSSPDIEIKKEPGSEIVLDDESEISPFHDLRQYAVGFEWGVFKACNDVFAVHIVRNSEIDKVIRVSAKGNAEATLITSNGKTLKQTYQLESPNKISGLLYKYQKAKICNGINIDDEKTIFSPNCTILLPPFLRISCETCKVLKRKVLRDKNPNKFDDMKEQSVAKLRNLKKKLYNTKKQVERLRKKVDLLEREKVILKRQKPIIKPPPEELTNKEKQFLRDIVMNSRRHEKNLKQVRTKQIKLCETKMTKLLANYEEKVCILENEMSTKRSQILQNTEKLSQLHELFRSEHANKIEAIKNEIATKENELLKLV